MKVDGGKVTITTSELLDENNQTSYHGNTHIKSEVYVTGGQMDIWGEMTNPRLEDIITVDITKQDDYFKDHREVPTTEKYYKLLYFAHFLDTTKYLYKVVSHYTVLIFRFTFAAIRGLTRMEARF